MPKKRSPAKRAKQATNIVRDTVLLGVGLLLIGCILRVTGPHFGLIEYSTDGGSIERVELPLAKEAEPNEVVKIVMNVTAGIVHSRLVQIVPDDCIERIIVNGIVASDTLGRLCLSSKPYVVDFGPYIHAGTNTIEMEISNATGTLGLDMRIATRDPLRIAILAIFIALVIWYCAMIAKRLPVLRTLAAPLAIGIILRVLYVTATPVAQYAYDLGGHIEYINYILQHWWLPPASAGWEFHQGPLYYFLAAACVRIGAIFGLPGDAGSWILQYLSLVLSIGTLIVCAWIATMVFDCTKRGKTVAATLFLSLCATIPGLVMFASRVTNETLFIFLGFTTLALLIRWWNVGGTRPWLMVIAAAGLTCLTKMNGLLLLPAIGMCLFWKRELAVREKVRCACFGLLLLTLLCGWLPIVRLLLEKDIVGSVAFGTQNMNPGLGIRHTVTNMLTFNPIAVAQIPFNDTWNDDYRRNIFWEFFFRSALFGEFRFPSLLFLGRTIVTLGMFCLPFLGIGVVTQLWKRVYDDAPLWLVGMWVLVGGLAFALQFPFSSTQDFRFSVLLFVPAVFALTRQHTSLPSWAKIILETAIAGLSLTCALFLLAVSFSFA